MADFINSPKVTLVSENNECKLHIVLDININSNSIDVKAKEEKTEWIIPEFNSGEKIKFGKKGE